MTRAVRSACFGVPRLNDRRQCYGLLRFAGESRLLIHMNTRRQFLLRAPLGLLVAASACRSGTPTTDSQSSPVAGAPPTFGTGAGAGPEVTPATFAEAEKLMQV